MSIDFKDGTYTLTPGFDPSYVGFAFIDCDASFKQLGISHDDLELVADLPEINSRTMEYEIASGKANCSIDLGTAYGTYITDPYEQKNLIIDLGTATKD